MRGFPGLKFETWGTQRVGAQQDSGRFSLFWACKLFDEPGDEIDGQKADEQ